MRRKGVREGKGGGERDRSHHDREHYADVWHHLEDTEQQEEGHLVEGVGMDAEVGDAAQVVVVWFVFVWDEWQSQTLDKLGTESEKRAVYIGFIYCACIHTCTP